MQVVPPPAVMALTNLCGRAGAAARSPHQATAGRGIGGEIGHGSTSPTSMPTTVRVPLTTDDEPPRNSGCHTRHPRGG